MSLQLQPIDMADCFTLAEIETEWDCYVAAYSEQHPNSVKTALALPVEWFEKWLEQANA